MGILPYRCCWTQAQSPHQESPAPSNTFLSASFGLRRLTFKTCLSADCDRRLTGILCRIVAPKRRSPKRVSLQSWRRRTVARAPTSGRAKVLWVLDTLYNCNLSFTFFPFLQVFILTNKTHVLRSLSLRIFFVISRVQYTSCKGLNIARAVIQGFK
jgi:hypothetical protein